MNISPVMPAEETVLPVPVLKLFCRIKKNQEDLYWRALEPNTIPARKQKSMQILSQAYRPVQFADLTAPPTTDIIDQDLKDAKGYNADLGYRGKVKCLFIF